MPRTIWTCRVVHAERVPITLAKNTVNTSFASLEKFRPERIVVAFGTRWEHLCHSLRRKPQQTVFEDGCLFQSAEFVIHLPNANTVRAQLPANDAQNVLEKFPRFRFACQRDQCLLQRV